MAARSIWSGTISLGLVSIPVRMFSATESKELRLHFVDRSDLAPRLPGAEAAQAQVEMARTLVENLSSEFDPSKYTDTYRAPSSWS